MKITYYSRYREERYFYQKDGNWYFDVAGDRHVGASINDDGSLYHIDPSGGPFISVKTNLRDLHKDLPNATPKSIEWDKEEGAYKLTVDNKKKSYKSLLKMRNNDHLPDKTTKTSIMGNMSDYLPDKWVILKIKDTYKVFAMWSGGYLAGDSWRTNSGIESVEETDNAFLFKGYSGSIYECRKSGYGCNCYGAALLDGWKKELDDFEIMSENTDWIKLIHKDYPI